MSLSACSGAGDVAPVGSTAAADESDAESLDATVDDAASPDGEEESGSSESWFDDLVLDAGPEEVSADTWASVDDAASEGDEEVTEEALPPEPPEELPWLDDPTWQCENGVPISVIVDVILAPNGAGCPWNEGENLNLIQGAFAAHQMTVAEAELPGPAQAICGVNLDSASFDPDFEQAFTYDDHFMLLFNDVVLLSSYGSLVQALPAERNLVLFDWPAIAGSAMSFNNTSAYCLGYGGDDPVSCSIPAPESNGALAYSIGGGLNAALSSLAVKEQRVQFGVVTFGDNDPESDCRNSELRMQVVVDYVIEP